MTEIRAPENKSIHEILGGENKKYFDDEIHKDIKHDKMGLIGTSNSGPNRNQANFFITLTDRPLTHMDGKYSYPRQNIIILKKIFMYR